MLAAARADVSADLTPLVCDAVCACAHRRRSCGESFPPFSRFCFCNPTTLDVALPSPSQLDPSPLLGQPSSEPPTASPLSVLAPPPRPPVPPPSVPEPPPPLSELRRRLSVPPAPSSPIGSCWHYFPSGCTNGGISAGTWAEDTWGPSNGYPGPSGCAERAAGQNSWCGVSDVISNYVTPPAPSAPIGSCWHYFPSGCANSGISAGTWNQDTYARPTP